LIQTEFEEKYKKKDEDVIEFDPAKHSPIFYGFSYAANKVDDEKLFVSYSTSKLTQYAMII
jgi:hypothetical protein